MMNSGGSFDFQTLMECHPDNRNNYKYLLRLMRRHVVIPFVGAGFSAHFGYQTWSEFLDDQVKMYSLQDMKDAMETYEYERAATILENYLKGGFEYTLMRTFGNHIYKESDNNELDCFPKLFQNLILTTNFDEVLEMLYAKVNGEHIDKLTPRSLFDVKLTHKRIACGEPTLIKLHGDVSSREFVLTEQSYDNIYGKHILDIRLPLPTFLRDILLSKVVLFLGCSLKDDRTLRVIEHSQIDGSISFALLELPKETENSDNPWNPQLLDGKNAENPKLSERRSFLNAHNIVPIWYPYRQHDALKIFLKSLASWVNPTASVTQIRRHVRDLLNEGENLGANDYFESALSYYTRALEVVRTNPEAFTEKMSLTYLNTIKSFYETNGYAFECKSIIKSIIKLTSQMYSNKSVELALCYHGIGYTYENYQYYDLMLKAMLKSQKILLEATDRKEHQNTDEHEKIKAKIVNASAYIYISTGYAFLKNEKLNEAKSWYQKAEELLRHNDLLLNDEEKAFIYNGLYRYQRLLSNYEEAIKTLERALEIRRKLYYSIDLSSLSDEKKRDILNHIINTHSNKIRVFLEIGKIKEAKDEFEFCRKEYPIWDSRSYMRDAKYRILTDYGDILKADGNAVAAYDQYKEALSYRKYLHFIDDFKAANLYIKIAESIKNMSDRENRLEEEMEYTLQAYLIYKKALGSNTAEVQKIQAEHLEELANLLSYSEKTLEQRLTAQDEFLKYRHDERLDNAQVELIRYFEL